MLDKIDCPDEFRRAGASINASSAEIIHDRSAPVAATQPQSATHRSRKPHSAGQSETPNHWAAASPSRIADAGPRAVTHIRVGPASAILHVSALDPRTRSGHSLIRRQAAIDNGRVGRQRTFVRTGEGNDGSVLVGNTLRSKQRVYSDHPSAAAKARAAPRGRVSLAVLRLMTSSNLSGCWIGETAGLSPRESFINVGCGRARIIGDTRGRRRTMHRRPEIPSWAMSGIRCSRFKFEMSARCPAKELHLM